MGSGLQEYNQTQAICGNPLPAGLGPGSKLPEPVFTPATKNDSGHDENVSFSTMINALGPALADRLRTISVEVFQWANAKLLEKGFMILDTKFEFGIANDEVFLIDEVLTPDSSRFCRLSDYEKARLNNEAPPSLDKQVIRDYLETLDWDKSPPPPRIPDDMLKQTRERYKEIEEAILCIS